MVLIQRFDCIKHRRHGTDSEIRLHQTQATWYWFRDPIASSIGDMVLIQGFDCIKNRSKSDLLESATKSEPLAHFIRSVSSRQYRKCARGPSHNSTFDPNLREMSKKVDLGYFLRIPHGGCLLSQCGGCLFFEP